MTYILQQIGRNRFNRIAIADCDAVTMAADGLGDALLGLLVCAGIHERRKETGRKLLYRVKDHTIPVISLFTGCDVVSANNDAFRGSQHRLNDGDRDYAWEMKTKQEMPRLARYAYNAGCEPGKVALRNPELIRRAGKDYAGCVILSPFSAWQARCWEYSHWYALAVMLQKAGYRPVVLTQTPTDIPCEQLLDVSAELMVGACLNAAMIIGNDSGVAHLGGILGRPTIAICGPTKGERIFGHYGCVTSLQGKLHCDKCCFDAPFDARCDPGCPSMQMITPREVADTVDRLTLEGIAQGRTAMDWRKLRVLRDCVRETESVAGTVAELGVWQGGSAKVIRHYRKIGDVLLFDTFSGMPFDDANGEHKHGDFADTSAGKVAAFVGDCELRTGVFPATAPDDVEYAFVHVDCDIQQSVEAALDYFIPRMRPGAILLFDDYGWERTPGIKQSVDSRFPQGVERVSEYQARVRF